MLFLALKLVLFGVGWLLVRAVIRAALGLVVALYWYPELAWAAAHPGAVARALGYLGLTALPVAGFVLILRWAHRRARQAERDR